MKDFERPQNLKGWGFPSSLVVKTLLLLCRAQVPSLTGELRSHMPRGSTTKIFKSEGDKKKMTVFAYTNLKNRI